GLRFSPSVSAVRRLGGGNVLTEEVEGAMKGRMRRILVLTGTAVVALGGLCGSAQAVTVTVTGPEEVAWDYDTMRCVDYYWPDGSVKAFRDSTGRLQLTAPFLRLTGTTFANLTTNCSL